MERWGADPSRPDRNPLGSSERRQPITSQMSMLPRTELLILRTCNYLREKQYSLYSIIRCSWERERERGDRERERERFKLLRPGTSSD